MIYLIPKTYFRFSQTIFFQISSFRNMYFLSLSTLSLYIPWIKWVKIIWKNDTNYNIPGIIVTFFSNLCTLSYKFKFDLEKKWQKDLTNLSNQRGEIFFLIPDHWSKGERWHYGQNRSKNAASFQSQKIFGIKYENPCN